MSESVQPSPEQVASRQIDVKQIAEDVWVCDGILPLLGVPFGVRTTIVRLSPHTVGSRLWVHSPVALTPQLIDSVGNLGEVVALVAPSNGHNLWLLDWHRAFPDATLYVTERIPAKLQLDHYTFIRDAMDHWPGDLDVVQIQGAPRFDEHVFFHAQSGSLIVTDIIQNHTGVVHTGFAGVLNRLLLRPVGFRDICLAPPIRRGIAVKDRDALQRSFLEILAFDFQRIVVAHGRIIENNARQEVERLFDLLFS